MRKDHVVEEKRLEHRVMKVSEEEIGQLRVRLRPVVRSKKGA